MHISRTSLTSLLTFTKNRACLSQLGLKALAVLALALAFADSSVAQTPTPTPCPVAWSAGANFPAAGVVRAVGNYFPLNGRFYVMGGRSSDAVGSDFIHPFEYNPETNTWVTKVATYPDNQVNNMACGTLTVSGTPQIYCVGGSAAGATTATARMFSYNPVTDTITPLASDNWPGNTGGANLPGGFAVFQNKLYIFGGFTIGSVALNTIYQFDPTQAAGSRWTLKTATLPVPLAYVPATAIGTLIFTGGGSTVAAGVLTDSNNSYVYNPVADSISTIASIPRATGETRALTVGNKMWVLGGGRTTPNPSNQVDIYDPVAGTWSTGMPFATARRNFPTDTDGSRVFLIGGYDTTGTGFVTTMENFTPGAGCPSPSPSPSASPTPSPSPSVSPSPCQTSFSGAITTSDPTQTGRLFRGGVASACGAPNACSTLAGTFHYDAYTSVNTSGSPACVTATLTTACAGTNFIFAGSYLNSFDPANICTNNIGDPGGSPNGAPVTWGFTVPAGATFVNVIAEVTADAGCAAYTLDLAGIPCGTPLPSPTPSPFTPSPSPSPSPTPCGTSYTRTTGTGATIVPGTALVPGSSCDDCSNPVTIPFSFSFYGTPFTTVNAISNGNLQFSSADTTFTNTCLPYTAANNLIAPHWDDLLLTGAGQGIFTSTTGVAPNRIFNIEWIGGYFSGGGTADFEVRLYEGTNQIDFVYGSVTQGGSSATIGIQRTNGAGGTFDQFACNTAGSVTTGLRVTYVPAGCGTPTPSPTPSVTPTPSPTPSVSPTPGGTTVQFSAPAFPGDESQVEPVTITRTGIITATTTVNFSALSGTATGGAACTSGVDFLTIVNQPVVFNPGETSKTVFITLCPDMLVELLETMNLSLTAVSGGA